MPTYTFLCSTDNRKSLNFEVANPPLQLQFLVEGNGVTMNIFWFGCSSFNVEIVSDRDIQDMGSLADIVDHTIAGLYDSCGLLSGSPFTARIEGFSVAGSTRFSQISQAIPNFAESIGEAGLTIHDWVSLAAGSPQLRASLRDIRLGMQTPGEAAVHCFRAIERIRQAFYSDARDRRRTWGYLRSALNIQRSWLDTYTAHATAVRHGELIELRLNDRNKCFTQAATVVIRYAAYLKGGRIALTEPMFPLLT
jgi:hypothetical protein